MKVSIIILSWNTRQLLKDCLRSVISDQQPATRKKPITEIIVVDNGSTDGSVEMVEEMVTSGQWLVASGKRKKLPTTNHQPPITLHLIKNKKNLGFAKGNNQGIRIAKGDLIMFLNSDTVVQKDAIKKLAQHLNQNKKTGAVCPLILNKDGSVQIDPVYLRYPSVVTALFYYNSFLRKIFLMTPLLRNVLFCPVDFKNPHPLEQLSGAALMVRKKVFDQVGLFDEKMSFYFEDSDLSKRIQKDGWKTLVEPAARIVHVRGGSVAQVILERKTQLNYYQRNFTSLLYFCEKHYSQLKTLSIKMALLFNWLIVSFFYLPVAIIKPKFWNKILINLKLIRYFTFTKTKKGELWS